MAWLGWSWADPLVALAITVAIGLVLRDAAREVFRRLLDGVDPDMVDPAEQVLRSIPGVREVGRVRLRWIGHRLHAEADLVVDADLSLQAAHEIAADAEHQLTHRSPGWRRPPCTRTRTAIREPRITQNSPTAAAPPDRIRGLPRSAAYLPTPTGRRVALSRSGSLTVRAPSKRC